MKSLNQIYHKLIDLLATSFKGYFNLFLRMGKFILFLAILFIATSGIVFPLWYLSTNYPNVYGTIVVGLIGTGVGFLPILRFYRSIRKHGLVKLKYSIVAVGRRIGLLVLSLILLWGVIRFYQVDNVALAAVLFLSFIVIVGIGLYQYYEKQR